MSDLSRNGELDNGDENSENVKRDQKSNKLKRTQDTLKIVPSEEELRFRSKFESVDVVKVFPDLLKCTRCRASFKTAVSLGKAVYSHPLLDVLFCKSCCEFYGDGNFSLDEDDEDKYCRWCGEGGKLFLCSLCICGFCPKCIKSHFGKEKLKEIDEDDDWICFFCKPKPIYKLRCVCALAQKAVNSKHQDAGNNSIFKSTPYNSIKNESNCQNNIASQGNSQSDSSNGSGNAKQKSSDKDSCTSKNKGASIKRQLTGSSSSEGSEIVKVKKRRKRARLHPTNSKEHELKTRPRTLRRSTRINPSNKELDSDSSSDSDSNSSKSDCEIKEKNENVQSKKKHCEKVKDILQVAEVTLELGLNLCQKKLKKFNKKDFVPTEVSLKKHCEKIKSIVLLLSSSLTTVHHMIESVERKMGVEKIPDSVTRSKGVSSVMRGVCQILRNKDINPVYIRQLMSTLVNQYQFSKNGVVSAVSNIDQFKEEIDRNGNIEIKSIRKEKSPNKNRSLNEIACDASTVIHYKSNESIDSKCSTLILSKNEENLSSDGDNLDIVPEDIDEIKAALLKSSSEGSDVSITDSDSDLFENKCTEKKNKRELAGGESSNVKTKDKLNYSTNFSKLNRSRQSCLPTNKETISEKSKINDCANFTESENSNNGGDQSNNDSSTSNYSQYVSGKKKFLEENAAMLKRFVLQTTSEDENESEEPKKDKKSRSKRSSKKQGSKPRRSWLNDRLLQNIRSDTSSCEEESKWESKMEREKANKKASSVTDSTDFSEEVKRPKTKRRRIISDSSENESDQSDRSESVKKASPGKGRRNIKKILKTDSLQTGTKQALKIENERKKKLAERNEEYQKLFPDAMKNGRLVLDFDRETKKVLLEVPEKLAKLLKPHQREGIKFMWDSCFESVATLEENPGSGCILAHCMGLGKTLQVITLVYTAIRNEIGLKTVLVISPYNVVNNWVNEFEYWLKNQDTEIEVYNMNKYKKYYERFCLARHWHETGGVMVIGYDMFRIVNSETRKNQKRGESFTKFLLDPGPDLVVCDEGHFLKNEGSSLSKCIRKIKTSRRILLTGTPLQNNLREYYSMVQFVKPNILGTRQEFMNRFGNPIINGQFEDSTERDVKLMRARSHILHKLLDGTIQRFTYSVMTPYLSEKHEYVISIRLTETQSKLYKHYLEKCGQTDARTMRASKLFSDFHSLQNIWTHPLVLLKAAEKKGLPKENSSGENSGDSIVFLDPNEDSEEKEYWKNVVKPEEYENFAGSNKLVILLEILRKSRENGDKVLVFSQSLRTLDFIEHFLNKINDSFEGKEIDIPAAYKDSWVRGVDYFRMDGSSNNDVRSRWCANFNKRSNTRCRLFLISTKAGGLGINLVGANRVVIFDVSWNPSHDVQSIFRVFRFGQNKICYVYRFVAEATMEEKVYARQVTKLSLEKRVLDEYQIERHYQMQNLLDLYQYDPLPKEKWSLPKLPKDSVLADILNLHKDIIVGYHEHDSLLENKEEEELTEEERKAAWEDYEKEKYMSDTMLKTFYNTPILTEEERLQKELLYLTAVYPYSSTSNFRPILPAPAPGQSLQRGQIRVVNIDTLRNPAI